MSAAVIAAQLLTSSSQLEENKFRIKYLYKTIKTCFRSLSHTPQSLVQLHNSYNTHLELNLKPFNHSVLTYILSL